MFSLITPVPFMNFLNPLPIYFWLLPLIPIIIFLINRTKYRFEKFSTIKYLLNLKTTEINRLKLINILLLILRTLIIIIILILVMKPHSNDLILHSNIKSSKVINHIFIDDSFSNKFGVIENQERLYKINDIVNQISSNSHLNSRLKIATFKKGLIYDGFNSKDIDYKAYEEFVFEYNNLDNFVNQDSSYINNIHLISNSNDNYIDNVNQMLKNNQNYNHNIFYHYLPISKENQYISHVNLISNLEKKFSFEIGLGNSSSENISINLGVYNNFYNYDKNLYLSKQIPLYTKEFFLESNVAILDTIQLELELARNSEVVFKLENIETKDDLIDNRIEDNFNSFIFDIPTKVSATVLFNDKNDELYLSSILNSFKIVTNNLDSNFFDIKYIFSNGVNQYSTLIGKENLLIFCGYEIFQNTHNSIIKDYLSADDTHIILFPNKNDAKNYKYLFELNDSLIVESLYYFNSSSNYDTVSMENDDIKKYRNFIDNKIKLNNYFAHTIDNNSKFKINSNKSVWSRYKINGNNFDLFGLVLNEGNNLFGKKSIISAPFLYSITLNEQIDYTKNNLILNEPFDQSNLKQGKYKVVDLYKNIIEAYDSEKPIISSRETKGLIVNDSLHKIISFNPSKINFTQDYNFAKINKSLTKNIITYDQFNKSSTIFNDMLYKADLSKYFIYALMILLIFEMLLSNARPSRSE